MRSLCLAALLLPALAVAADSDSDREQRRANTVILDEAAEQNLHIETAEAEETTFEETVFALGHLEVLPGKRAVVSSRIPGRAFSVLAVPDQQVEEGDELIWVESRQPGDPPPTVMLAAPMAGLIARVEVAVGQPLTPDQTLMEIVDLEVVEASARVPQHMAGKLAKGQRARIRVAGFPDQTFEAELAHLGAYADAESGTVEAAFHLSNPDHLLRPGMRAEFNIVVRSRGDVMSIPAAAVLGDATGRFVFIRDYELDHAFVKTPIVLGARNDQFVEVVSGLLPGDEVVVRGGYPLAFAGKGTVSLKEALDAAHGHAHAADGSELSEAKGAGKPNQADDHDHEHDHGEREGRGHDHGRFEWNVLTVFFAASTGLLLILLAALSFHRRANRASA